MTTRKLGKLAPKQDQRTLKLASYINQLPPIPAAINWYATPEAGSPGFSWEMLLNDQLGCCAIAGPAHIEMLWSDNAGRPYTATNDCVMAGYEAVGGYNPADPSTDNGCVLLNVMNYWRNVGLCNHKINSYVQVNPANLEHIKAAIYLFGAVNIGLALPLSAQEQDVWDVEDSSLQGKSAPGSWGGHCVIIGKYDDVAQEFTCVTWGQEKKMTYDYFKTYCDEAYAAISDDWINNQGISPAGFNMSALQADLAAVR